MIIINCTEDDVELASTSARLRWVLLMLHYWAYSRNRPMATDEKKKILRYFSMVFISPVGRMSGKSVILLPPDGIF